MLDQVFGALTLYYGLDWVTLILGQIGAYLITSKNRWGFLISVLACMTGFTVAVMSGQYGFVLHNGIMAFIMVRGFMSWSVPSTVLYDAAE